jgi:hypothetical protein
MGLMLQPFWNPGIKVPGPEAKGAVIGFGDVHTRAHLYRAILEGLAYALREGRERIERRGGWRIERVRVSGGGSQSDAAMQITANVFNLPDRATAPVRDQRPRRRHHRRRRARPASRLRHRRARDDPRRTEYSARKHSTCAPTTSSTARSIAHVPSAAAALPRHPGDHRLSGRRRVASRRKKSPPQGWARDRAAERKIRRPLVPGSPGCDG